MVGVITIELFLSTTNGGSYGTKGSREPSPFGFFAVVPAFSLVAGSWALVEFIPISRTPPTASKLRNPILISLACMAIAFVERFIRVWVDGIISPAAEREPTVCRPGQVSRPDSTSRPTRSKQSDQTGHQRFSADLADLNA